MLRGKDPAGGASIRAINVALCTGEVRGEGSEWVQGELYPKASGPPLYAGSRLLVWNPGLSGSHARSSLGESPECQNAELMGAGLNQHPCGRLGQEGLLHSLDTWNSARGTWAGVPGATYLDVTELVVLRGQLRDL